MNRSQHVGKYVHLAFSPAIRLGSARHLHASAHPFNLDGAYVNFLMDDEIDGRVQASYGANYPKLAAVKKKYDPRNLFRVNQNIRPAA